VRRKRPSKRILKDKAWKAFSAYIRQKYADFSGFVACVTCGIKKNWKEMQAGHFIDGRMNAILFEEDCVHPQCYSCNCMKHGNKVLYYKFMIKKYGQDLIDKLIHLSKQTKLMTEEDYQNIYDKYKGYLA